MDESDTDTSIEVLINTVRASAIVHSLLAPSNDEELLLNKLRGLVTNIKWTPTDAADLFDALLQRFELTATDRAGLHQWLLKMLHCIEINFITPSWRFQKGKTLIELVQDVTITDENLQRILSDTAEKSLDEIIEEIRQEKLNQVDEKLLAQVKDIVSSVDEALTSNKNVSQQSDLKKKLLVLCQAVKKVMNYRPRLTHMVSWCIMALSGTGRLLQVGTGEGKSCIVAMFAAYRALEGEKVDIMSSSSVLAERDLNQWQDFYKSLKISVTCNTNKIGTDLKKCYEHQVVYGTVEEFAGDWLRHHFERMDVFGQRKFHCAIVDEVDSLMLDKGHHVVYIGSEMPALQHLNPLLAFIWKTVEQYKKVGTKTIVGQKYPFFHFVFESIKGKDIDQHTVLQMAEDANILPKGSVKELRKNQKVLIKMPESITVKELAKFFEAVEKRFPTCQFALHCMNDDGEIEELNEGSTNTDERQRVPLLLINGGFCHYMYSDQNSVKRSVKTEVEGVLCFTPCDLSQNEGRCYVPGFLSDLVKSKLQVWIDNAFYAQTMKSEHQYIIEKHGVIPVDYSCTGVVENCMKWTDGLHQFLEMKHESKLSDMTVITNYMSNVGLLQKYGGQIFGVSGTLGQQAETETLQKIYDGVQTCQIPTFKHRKLFEVEGMIADEEKEWMEKICDVVIAQSKPASYRAQRAVLVICETINRAKDLYDALGDKVPQKKLYISNNMDNTAIFAKKLVAGEVIIATNLAGRGTDLQVSDQVKTAGGLFVVQTFLPKNARVEAQAFGRTARQGSPGSAQLIICLSHLSGQMLVLTRKLESLLSAKTNITPLYKDLFMAQLSLYQRVHSNEQRKAMSATLSHVLTEHSNSAIKTVKKIRDDAVGESLASYLECDIPKLKRKEVLFNHYLNILDEVYRSSNNKPADSELSALNEFWGMWLLTSFNLDDSIFDLKDKLARELETARQKLRQRESPSSNLHHYTVFGNELREKGLFSESIRMYTKAIQEDHCWAAIAYYNRACTSLIQKNKNQDPNCINQALEDLQNSLKSVDLYCEQILFIHGCTKQQTEDPCSDSLTRFDSHMVARYEVLFNFKANINEAIKKLDRARVLGRTVKVNKNLVYFLVPMVNLLPMMILSVQSVSLIRSRDPLKIQQLSNHPSMDIFNELNVLKSLGLTHIYTLDTLFSLCGFFSKIGRTMQRGFDYLLCCIRRKSCQA